MRESGVLSLCVAVNTLVLSCAFQVDPGTAEKLARRGLFSEVCEQDRSLLPMLGLLISARMVLSGLCVELHRRDRNVVGAYAHCLSLKQLCGFRVLQSTLVWLHWSTEEASAQSAFSDHQFLRLVMEVVCPQP